MKQIMTIKRGVSFLAVLAVLALGPAWASACSNLGPEKHMGIVLQLDPIKGTMALMDAETQTTLHFVMAEDLLKKINVNDRIVITFHKKKDQLVAKDIVVQVSKRGVMLGG